MCQLKFTQVGEKLSGIWRVPLGQRSGNANPSTWDRLPAISKGPTASWSPAPVSGLLQRQRHPAPLAPPAPFSLLFLSTTLHYSWPREFAQHGKWKQPQEHSLARLLEGGHTPGGSWWMCLLSTWVLRAVLCHPYSLLTKLKYLLFLRSIPGFF